MSLQFILGPSGGGKSHYLYENLIEEAKKDRTKDFLLIVPEQFTMQTQKELVERSKNHAIMNIDVLSFERLAFRVFDELGIQKLDILEETGKNLILRKLAEEHGEELTVLGAQMKKMGYVSELKSLISEFMQYQITPQEIEGWLKGENSQAFQLKMRDVQLIYQEFLNYLQGNCITAEEVLQECAQVADRSLMLKNSNLIFDGFTGFTPVQMGLLETLFPMADRIQVAVTVDKETELYTKPVMQELFYMSKKMIQSLIHLAQETGCEVLEPVYVEEGLQHRYENAGELEHLQKNLFRAVWKPYEKKTENISIHCLQNPKEELLYAAAKIHHMVQAEGYRYKDFAIVSGNTEGYSCYAKEIFEAYEIPYFVDEKKTILFHPFIEFIRASLEMIEEDFSYESVMRYFRTGLSGQETEQIDRLENYLLAGGIKGYKAWSSTFEKCPKGYTEEELLPLEKLRADVMEKVEPCRKVLKKKDATVAERLEALYHFIVQHNMQEQLREKQNYFEEQQNFTRAKEYEQIYGIVMDLFDKMAELLGDQKISTRECSQILDAGFEAAKVGVLPPGYDCVLLGDIERTRLDHIKVLFFVGVNDGMIPKSAQAGGILSALEREKLSEQEVQLAPTPRERTFLQKFYLYLNMTKPQRRLILTFARVNAKGESIRRSYLIGQMKKLYPHLIIEEGIEPELLLATPRSGMEYFLEGLQEKQKQNDRWLALAAWYLEESDWKQEAEGLIDASFYSYRSRKLPKGLVHALYGTVLENSVTRLEQFASCACAHYLKYGLRLQERQLQEFSAVDFGNIFHSAIENFSKQAEQEGILWTELSEEQQQKLEEVSFLQALEEQKLGNLGESAKSRFLAEQMRRVYHRTIVTLTEQLKRGRFTPSGYEIGFSGADKLEALQFTLNDEEKMYLRGRIDRLDTYETEDKVYVKIIDYKTGKTNFQMLNLYHGLQLQLVVYLNAAMEMTKKKNPGKIVAPAGIFYYHVEDPFVESEGRLSEEEIYENILEELKLDGMVNSEEEVYRAMDEQMGDASHVIPVKVKKDGTLYATSKVLSQQAFENMEAFVGQKIKRLGNQMMAGEQGANPYRQGKQEACTYCSYRSVCGFDEKIQGYEYRNLQRSAKTEDVLQKISEDLINEGKGEAL